MDYLFQSNKTINMHTPVLLNEVLVGLRVHPAGRYVDGTYGEGGHAQTIAAQGGNVLGIDLDEGQVTKSKSGSIKVVQGNYADIATIAQKEGFSEVDGVLLDFGLSMEQLSHSKRGFSYKHGEEPLDMRIDGVSADVSAADIVNSYSRQELTEMFSRNAEQLGGNTIANALKSGGKVKTVADVVDRLGSENESTLKRIFQALRIEVNHEFENIKAGIEGAYEITKIGGRIAIISFHSVEDRIVKQWARSKGLKEIMKQKGGAHAFERSAVLRIYQK